MFSMEYVEGRDIAEVVKTHGPLPAAQAASYVLQAAQRVAARLRERSGSPRHQAGKPHSRRQKEHGENPRLRTRQGDAHRDGEAAEGLTCLNMMMGTPDYMAPEQARDAANVDVRADIYSLGCTLYCLLTGRPPFDGGSLATKIAAHQLSEPNPVESLRPDLPAGLAEVVRKMMAKDPTDRFQTPEEVMQALTTCLKAKQPTTKASPRNAGAARGKAVAPFAIGRLFVEFRTRLAGLLLFRPQG